MVTDSQCSYSCNTILVVANLLLSASLSKHPMDVYSYATEEHRDFKSLYKNVADCKSATTEKSATKFYRGLKNQVDEASRYSHNYQEKIDIKQSNNKVIIIWGHE